MIILKNIHKFILLIRGDRKIKKKLKNTQAIRKHLVKREQYWTLNIFLSISGFRNPRISESCRCLKERALWINCRHWRSPDDWKRCQNDAKSCWQTFEAKPASFDKWTHLELNFLTWLRKLSPITYQCFKKCHQIY